MSIDVRRVLLVVNFGRRWILGIFLGNLVVPPR